VTTLQVPFYQVDAFAERPFGGNPAAVCVLPQWLPDGVLQAIAAENNLSETAFLVDAPGARWRLRWFTPTTEVDLCGHATLAAGAIVLEELDDALDLVELETTSGVLTVRRASGSSEADAGARRYELRLPARPATPLKTLPREVVDAIGLASAGEVVWSGRARDLLVVLERAEDVRGLNPDFGAIAALDEYALCVTAPGTGRDRDVDFVSRFFAPAQGVDEDPVTGSAHCTLAPYWSERIGGGELRARQVSEREGELGCNILPAGRVAIRGTARRVIDGTFHVPR